MLRKLLVTFAVLGLVMAFAGTVPGPGSSFRLKLSHPAVVSGTELKAGEYRVNMGAEKVTFVKGSTAVDAKVKMEAAQEKFPATAVRYTIDAGKSVISEIRIGGSSTRLVFNP